jgi:hypothetical protein
MTKRNRNHIFQLVTVLGLIFLVWFSFGRNVLSPPKHPGVPEELAGMKLGNFKDGPEALAQVNKLHGAGIELANAFIAEYSHDFNPYHENNERLYVWVGETINPEMATALTADMVKAIGTGSQGFSAPKPLTINGWEVFQVAGPGGEHFFYTSSKTPTRIIWLIVKSNNSLSVLDKALEVY